MVVVSAVNARGTDLRPGRNTDLVDLISEQTRRNADLSRQLGDLRREVDQLAVAQSGGADLAPALGQLARDAGVDPVVGPAVTVTLKDAPSSVTAHGVDPDLLVVHSQDIQAVVNALWAGGAEAMTIQGQRVIATTGVKCVGNAVVLHGVPYAPPYVITAIGNQGGLEAALSASQPVRIYRQYVAAYGLGYGVERLPRIVMPGHTGALDVQSARLATSNSAVGRPPAAPR